MVEIFPYNMTYDGVAMMYAWLTSSSVGNGKGQLELQRLGYKRSRLWV